MNKLFINTLIQYGGIPSDSDAVLILNAVSKHINKKMKILEYKYGIKLKLNNLSINNWDCIPKSIGIQTYAQIDGPLQGRIPIYTKTKIAIPMPTISAVTTGIPMYGNQMIASPMIGIPTIAINPFGNTNTIEDRNNNALKYLEIIKSIDTQLDELKNGTIDKSSVDKTYFDFVDLDESDSIEKLKNLLGSKV